MADLIKQIKGTNGTVYDLQDKVSTFGGTNLVIGTSDEGSSGYTPAVNGTNQTSAPNHAGYFPANSKSGDIFTLYFEVEFSGVTAGSGGSFAGRIQGSCVKNGSNTGSNTGNPGTGINITSVPADGIYVYKNTVTANANITDETIFYCGARADYGGSGKGRGRKVKVEKGSKPTQGTPAPQDLIKDIGNETIEFFQ